MSLVHHFECDYCETRKKTYHLNTVPKGWYQFWEGDTLKLSCPKCVAIKFLKSARVDRSGELHGPPENLSGIGSHPCVPGNVCNDRPCTEGPVELAMEEALITSDEKLPLIFDQSEKGLRNKKRELLRELLGEG